MTSIQPQHDTSALEDQAMLIAGEIFNLINQYTHDSNVAKFFLPDEIARACYGLAGGFSSVIYIPVLDPEAVEETHILSFFYALMTYGCNLYLRERSYTTNASPYSLPMDASYIKKLQKKTLNNMTAGKLTSTRLADKIIAILSENIDTQMNFEEFAIKGHELNKDKFLDYAKLSMYWGYNFAGELLKEKKIKNTAKS